MKLTCCQLKELLLDFLAGELSGEQCEEMRIHIQRCPPCGVLVETYKITIQLGKCLPCHQMPPGLEARLRKAIEECRE